MRNKHSFFLGSLYLLVWTAWGTAPEAPASAFTVHKIFGSNMVLQSDRPIRISGNAAPGEIIRVSLGSHCADGVAGKDGEWCVELPAMKAGMRPYTVTVSGGGRQSAVVFENVLIGEVWLASGQSNMEMPVYSDRPFWGSANGAQEAAAAHYPGIRFFDTNRCRSLSPGVEQKEIAGPGWTICSPESAAPFSALGYYFARELYRELNVPIGIISSSWGGSPVRSWISRDGFLKGGRSSELSAIEEITAPPSAAREADRNRLKKELAAATLAWQERFLAADPAATAAARAWKEPDFDDSEWPDENIVGQPAYDFDGVFWYRRTVQLPASWSGRELSLSLGVIDDCDETFFNGEQVGATGLDISGYWKQSRLYRIPGRLVRPGDNTIAIRVTDFSSIGGVKGPASRIVLQLGKERISLAGLWKYRVEYKVDRKRIGSRPAPPAGMLISKSSHHFPGTLYNSMIAPWTRYAIRGVIWYQGESDVGQARDYMTLFPLLIRDWRSKWHDPELPFLFVQLAPLEHHMPSLPGPAGFWKARQPGNSELAELREVQAAALALPATGMAVTLDIGDPFNVHPADKQTVARRLACEARRLCYGSSVVSAGPIFERMRIEGRQIRLFFRNTGSGLTARGRKPEGFAIADRNGQFVWAEAEIDGDTVVVRADGIPAPQAVRYAWASFPGNANLFNREGFPAAPFRTDRPDYLLKQSCSTCEKEYRHEEQ